MRLGWPFRRKHGYPSAVDDKAYETAWKTETCGPDGTADGMLYTLDEGADLIARMRFASYDEFARLRDRILSAHPDDMLESSSGYRREPAYWFVASRTDRNRRSVKMLPSGPIIHELDHDAASRDTYYSGYAESRRPDEFVSPSIDFPATMPYSLDMKWINGSVLGGGRTRVSIDWSGSGPSDGLLRKPVDMRRMEDGRRIDLFGYGYRHMDELRRNDPALYRSVAACVLLVEALETGRWQELPDSLQPRYRELADGIRTREEQPYFPLKEMIRENMRRAHEDSDAYFDDRKAWDEARARARSKFRGVRL